MKMVQSNYKKVGFCTLYFVDKDHLTKLFCNIVHPDIDFVKVLNVDKTMYIGALEM